MNKVKVEVTINNMLYSYEVEASMTLLEFIREEVGLVGTKSGCENGECGACTVLMDGRPVRSCIILAAEANGTSITTVEGLAEGDEMHPLQQAFIDAGAVQCGFCAPGVLVAGKALLDRNPDPTKDDVYEALGGHLCRCAAYTAMSDAVHMAAEAIHEKTKG